MQAATLRAVDKYQQVAVQSRSPLELVVMLYDGALRFMTAAREAIERGDLVAKRDAVSRALAIVSELRSTLNMKEGAEIAASLDALYGFVTERLLEANVQKDPGAIDDALQVMRPLRDAWDQIAQQPGDRAGQGGA